jgi:hypothetical protein
MTFYSINSVGQIESIEGWPNSIKTEFEVIKKNQIDTFLIYYSDLGPWNNLADSCNNITSVLIIWTKQNKYFGKELQCDFNNLNKSITISSIPMNYFLNHLTEFEEKMRRSDNNEHLLLTPTDSSWEFIVFMTKDDQIHLGLSEDQRNDREWQKFNWIRSTIELIDLVKEEFEIENNRR